MIKVGDHIGVPQGGPVSPLAATISLNEVDWAFDAIRRKTAEGDYEAVNSHRFADDMVITVSGHRSKRGWAQRALQCLQESLTPLGVSLHPEKTTMVDTLQGEACSFLGFDLCRVGRRRGEGHFIVITPKKSARLAIKAKMREVIRQAGATPAHGGDCLDQPGFGGMGAVCSVWPCESSLQRRARRCRDDSPDPADPEETATQAAYRLAAREECISLRSPGLMLGLERSVSAERGELQVKVVARYERAHNPYGEAQWVSGVRENLTSRSDGEGLETGPWDRLRHRHEAKAAGKQLIPVP